MNIEAQETVETIFKYITAIQPIRDYENILMKLADMGRELAKADRCTVWVVDEAKNDLWTKVSQGIDAIRIELNSGIVGEAISQGKALIRNDVSTDKHFNSQIDKQTGYHTKNMMVIPMYNGKNEIIGAFQVVNKIDGDFNEKDLKYLSLAAMYSAETLSAALLAEENSQTQKDMIFLMTEAIEKRSKETGNHIKRVSAYSRLLAIAYGMSEEDAYVLEFSSPMHDIGKIGIPDAILNKPGKLTEEEFKVMKEHALLGYEILSASNKGMLKAAAILAYEHHEKWDGSGYPNSKKGDEIHIFGRITAVADVFDALGSDRCYKKAWPLEDVLEFFEAQKGKHFDPEIVELLFSNLDAIVKIRDTYTDGCLQN